MVPLLQVLCVAGSLGASALTLQSAGDGNPLEKFSIIMADTRDAFPDVATVSMEELSWFEVASMINFKYAQTHGYDFRLYKLPKEGCMHMARNVSRHPAWCKLLGLVEAKNEFGDNAHRVYLDSDMFVQKTAIDISMQEVLGAAIPRKTAGSCKICSSTDAECLKLPQRWGALLPAGGPGLLGALVVQRAGAHGDKVLQNVWNTDHHAQEFPWEQAAWDDVFESQDGGTSMVVGISALQDRSWTGHGYPFKCGQFDGGITLDTFATHECHFQDDHLLMALNHQAPARDRIRKSLGCGPQWMDKCLSNKDYADAIERHNLYHGNRKIKYAETFTDIANTMEEVARLYRDVRARVKELSEEQMHRLASELERGAKDNRDLPGGQDFLRRHPDYGAEVEREMSRVSGGGGQVPLLMDPRQHQCWCDGP